MPCPLIACRGRIFHRSDPGSRRHSRPAPASALRRLRQADRQPLGGGHAVVRPTPADALADNPGRGAGHHHARRYRAFDQGASADDGAHADALGIQQHGVLAQPDMALDHRLHRRAIDAPAGAQVVDGVHVVIAYPHAVADQRVVTDHHAHPLALDLHREAHRRGATAPEHELAVGAQKDVRHRDVGVADVVEQHHRVAAQHADRGEALPAPGHVAENQRVVAPARLDAYVAQLAGGVGHHQGEAAADGGHAQAPRTLVAGVHDREIAGVKGVLGHVGHPRVERAGQPRLGVGADAWYHP